MQYDIFISYKRRGTSSATAAYIYDLLTKKGYSVFFDRKEMSHGSFNKQLYEHIENAKDIFILLEDQSLAACFNGNSILNENGNSAQALDEGTESEKSGKSYRESYSQAYKSDWFCMEIMHALEVKQRKGDDCRIIPLLLEGYNMPDASRLPPEIRTLALQNAIPLVISEIEDFYKKWLIEKKYLLSKPRNLFIDQDGVADFLFYSKGDCDIYECGHLVGRLDQNIDEDHPYIYSVKRAGEHRFKIKNNDTCEEQRVSAMVEKDRQQYVPIVWQMSQNLWDVTNEIIKKQDDSRKLFFWGKGLYEGTSKHAPNYRLAFDCIREAADLRYTEARNFIMQNYELFINKDGKVGFKDKDEEKSLKCEWLRSAADFGNASAQCLLGRKLYYGQGIEKNWQDGLKYYQLASKQKDPQALYDLGYIYCIGCHKKVSNVTKGLEYYECAAESGNAQALIALGNIYLEGWHGVKQDKEKGKAYYAKAAEINDSNILYQLATIFFGGGHGIDIDVDKGLELYERSAMLNSTKALSKLGEIYLEGLNKVEKNPAKGFKNYKKAADLNDSQSIFMVAEMLLTGKNGVEKHKQLGLEYLKKIESLNEADSLVELGKIYINGKWEIEKDIQKGRECFYRAANNENIKGYSLIELGDIFFNGLQNLPKDVERAAKYYELAYCKHARRKMVFSFCSLLAPLDSRNDDNYMLNRLNDIYFMGGDCFVPKISQGIECYERMAAKRPEVWFALGRLYLEGDKGIAKNVSQGIECYENAIQSNDLCLQAAELLASIYLNGGYQTTPNPTKVVKLYEWVAQKNPIAWKTLGDLYLNGCQGIPKNSIKATECYERAAQKEPSNWATLGDLYLTGDKGIPQNVIKGIECYEKAICENPNVLPETVERLASIYLNGEYGVIPNPTKATECYEYAAQKDPSNWTTLGDLYLTGNKGIPQNVIKGIECYENAIYEDPYVLPETVERLASIYLNGEYGISPNTSKAVECYERAAQRDPSNWITLGDLYLTGNKGIPQNIIKGIECYENAIYEDPCVLSETVERLASIYLNGEYGISPNPTKAVMWYKKALSLGSKKAAANIRKAQMLIES